MNPRRKTKRKGMHVAGTARRGAALFLVLAFVLAFCSGVAMADAADSTFTAPDPAGDTMADPAGDTVPETSLPIDEAGPMTPVQTVPNPVAYNEPEGFAPNALQYTAPMPDPDLDLEPDDDTSSAILTADDLIAALENGSGVVTIDGDISVTGLERPVSVASAVTELNLASHTLTLSGSSTATDALLAVSGAFRVSGGKIVADNAASAIRATDTGASVTLNGATIEVQSGLGRAVLCSDGANLTVNGGSIHGTTGVKTNVVDGGAVYVTGQDSSVVLSGGKIENTTGLRGGAVYAANGASVQTNGSSLVKGCTAQSDGGALCLTDNAEATIRETVLTENKAATNGGAIAADGAAITLGDNAVLTNNTAGPSGTSVSRSAEESVPMTSGLGGAIWVGRNSTLTTNAASGSPVRITDNAADAQGGGIWADASASVNLAGEGQVTGNSAAGEASDTYGVSSATDSFAIGTREDETVTEDPAGNDALGLEGPLQDYDPTDPGSEVEPGNGGQQGAGPGDEPEPGDGEPGQDGVPNDTDSADTANDPGETGEASDDDAESTGEQSTAQRLTEQLEEGKTVSLDENLVLDGPIDVPIDATNWELRLNNHSITARFTSDDSLFLVSGVLNVVGPGTVTLVAGRSIFDVVPGGKLTVSSGTKLQIGGAARRAVKVQGSGAYVSITDSTINGQGSALQGGAIEIVGDPSGNGVPTVDLKRVTIEQTEAQAGGAIFITGGKVTLQETTIKNCFAWPMLNAGAKGGAIYAAGGTVNLTGSSITDCIAGCADSAPPSLGGGIYAASGTSLTISGGAITGCSASKGGGMFLERGVSRLQLQDQLQLGPNTPATDGGVDGDEFNGFAEGVDVKVTLAPTESGTSDGSVTTLEKLIECLNDGKTGKLGCDIEGAIESPIAIGSESTESPVVLDLNGHTLKVSGNDVDLFAISGTQSFTITDRSTDATGKITFTSGKNIVAVSDAASAELAAGTLEIGAGTWRAVCVGSSDNAGSSNFKMSGGRIVRVGSASTDLGGAIYMDGQGSGVQIDGGVISGCPAGSGGAIYVDGGELKMKGGLITDCTATNGDEGGGGAVYVRGGTFTMSEPAVIENCRASSGYGGGVYVVEGSFKMDGGTVSRCTARFGGGVFNDKSFTMTAGKIEACKASVKGGGVYNRINTKPGSFSMDGGSIRWCVASTNLNDQYSKSDNHGGGVYSKASFTMTGNSEISDCRAAYGGGMYIKEGTAEIESGTVARNLAAKGSGGGIYVVQGTKLTFGSASGPVLRIVYNQAQNQGGGIFFTSPNQWQDQDITIQATEQSPIHIWSNSYNTENTTNGKNPQWNFVDLKKDLQSQLKRYFDVEPDDSTQLPAGTGIADLVTAIQEGGSNDISVEEYLGELTNEDAPTPIFLEESISITSSVTLDLDRDLDVIMPATPGKSGWVRQSLFDVTSQSAVLTIKGAGTIRAHGAENIVKVEKGSFKLESGTLEIQPENHRAVFSRGNFTMTGGTISGRGQQDQQTYGGAVWMYGQGATMTFSGGTISDTYAKDGGGVALYSAAHLDMDGDAKISGCEASGNGGGIALYNGSTMTIEQDASISNCVASGNGGGIVSAVDDPQKGGKPGQITIAGGNITGNKAGQNGGGVYGSAISMTGATVSYNTAELSAGGIWADSFTMTGGTISSNHALCNGDNPKGGGGLLIAPSGECDITYGAISGNTSEHVGGGIHLDTGATAWIGKSKSTLPEGVSFTTRQSTSDAENKKDVEICGNKATNNRTGHGYAGGGVFVEGHGDDNAKLYVHEAIVRDNNAAFGGGVAGCAVSDVTVYAVSGAAIYGNTATRGLNASVVGDQKRWASSRDLYCEGQGMVDSVMLGGVSSGWTGWATNEKVSFDSDCKKLVNFALTNRLTEKESSASRIVPAIESKAKVLISDNTSNSGGGGVGGNGTIQFGEDPGNSAQGKLTVVKASETVDGDASQRTWAADIDVVIKDETGIIKTKKLELSSDTGKDHGEVEWDITAEHPGPYTYEVKESKVPVGFRFDHIDATDGKCEPVDGQERTYTGSVNQTGTVTVTNVEEKGKLTVVKSSETVDGHPSERTWTAAVDVVVKDKRNEPVVLQDSNGQELGTKATLALWNNSGGRKTSDEVTWDITEEHSGPFRYEVTESTVPVGFRFDRMDMDAEDGTCERVDGADCTYAGTVDQTGTVTVTNVEEKGKLTVVKSSETVNGNPSQRTWTAAVDVVVKDKNSNDVVLQDSNGQELGTKATLTLWNKSDGQKTSDEVTWDITEEHPGPFRYEVTESTVPVGFNLEKMTAVQGVCSFSETKKTGTGTVDREETVTVTNVEVGTPTKGKLVIVKSSVTPDGAPSQRTWNAAVEVVIRDGDYVMKTATVYVSSKPGEQSGEVEWDITPEHPGPYTYEVAETQVPGGFKLAKIEAPNQSCSFSAADKTGTGPVNRKETVTVTNVEEKGKLTVVKASQTADGKPSRRTWAADVEVVIKDGTDIVKTETLRLSSDTGKDRGEVEWDITAEHPGPYTYEVKESKVPVGFSFDHMEATYGTCTPVGEAECTYTGSVEQTETVTVTNIEEKRKLTIVKVSENANGEPSQREWNATVDVVVRCADQTVKTQTLNLSSQPAEQSGEVEWDITTEHPGPFTYEVQEKEVPAGFKLETMTAETGHFSFDQKTGVGSGILDEAETIVTVTNKEAAGGLTVTKNVVGTTPGETWECSFEVTIDNETQVIQLTDQDNTWNADDIPLGTSFEVRETKTPSGYVLRESAGTTGEITEESQHCEVYFTNEKGTSEEDGSLTIAKSVSNLDAAEPWAFVFDVTIGDATEQVTLTNETPTWTRFQIPKGTHYSVVEKTGQTGYTLVSSSGASGTIESTTQANFVNRKTPPTPTPTPSNSVPPTPPVPSNSVPPTPPVPSSSVSPTPPVPSNSVPPTSPAPSNSVPPTSPVPSNSEPSTPPVPSSSVPPAPSGNPEPPPSALPTPPEYVDAVEPTPPSSAPSPSSPWTDTMPAEPEWPHDTPVGPPSSLTMAGEPDWPFDTPAGPPTSLTMPGEPEWPESSTPHSYTMPGYPTWPSSPTWPSATTPSTPYETTISARRPATVPGTVPRTQDDRSVATWTWIASMACGAILIALVGLRRLSSAGHRAGK